MRNKWLIMMLSVMAAGLGLLMIQGCEDSKDTDLSGDLTNDFASESRDSYDTIASEQEIQLTPSGATASRVGEKITFTAQGGQTPYAWSVTDTAVGTVSVQENTHYATYTVATIAKNEIIVQDNKGVRASAAINYTNTVALSITPSPLNITPPAAGTRTLTATGGTAPFTWYVNNTALGTIGATGTTVTYTSLGVTIGTNTITLIDANGTQKTTPANHIN